MQIDLTLEEALAVATTNYAGASDVLTETRRSGETISSLDWWLSDGGRRADRGWQGRRDWAALATYRHLAQHGTEPMAADAFPVEFVCADGRWCRPDKDVIKQGLRRQYLGEVMDGDRLVGFRLTAVALRDLEALGLRP